MPYLTVGQFVGLLEGGGGGGGGHFLLEVEGDIAELLLDVTHDFTLSGGGEAVAALGQDLHQVVGQVATGQVETEDGVGQSVTCPEVLLFHRFFLLLSSNDRTFIDGDSVGDTIAGVKDDTGGTTGGVEREDGLDGDVHGRAVEGLEHDLE